MCKEIIICKDLLTMLTKKYIIIVGDSMKRITLFLLTLLLIIPTCANAKTLNDYYDELKQLETLYNTNKNNKKLTAEQIQEINNEITQINISITNTRNEIKETEKEIEESKVKITDGPFKNMIGKVNTYDLENKKVEVMLDLFGQETSVEVQLSEIENLK